MILSSSRRERRIQRRAEMLGRKILGSFPVPPQPEPSIPAPAPVGSGSSFGGKFPKEAGVVSFHWYRSGLKRHPGQLRSRDLGLYSSKAAATANDHIAKWQAISPKLRIGMDLWYHDTWILESIRDTYIPALEAAGMKYFFFWDRATPATVNDAETFIRDQADNPNYWQYQGRPVLMVFNAFYDAFPISLDGQTLAPLWSSLAPDFHIIWDRGAMATNLLIQGMGWTFWDVPFVSRGDLQEKFRAAVANKNITRWAFHIPGFDNRAVYEGDAGFSCTYSNQQSWTVWPRNQSGFPDGPSVAWLAHQWDLIGPNMAHLDGVFWPWNELNEITCFEPTDPAFGNACGVMGDSGAMYEQMRAYVQRII